MNDMFEINKYTFKINDSNYGFYIHTDGYDCDCNIAGKLKMSEKYYQNNLIKQFNGYYSFGGEVFFKKYEDAEKALDWINSIIMIEKLRGVE